MRKALAFAVVAVLVAGSTAVAQINLQGQDWNLGLTNLMNLTGGPSEAETIQGIGTLSMQNIGINPDQNGDPTASASEGIGAALFQTGEVETGGATADLKQHLTLKGATLGQMGPGQVQSVGDLAGPAQEFQAVAVNGDQTLTKGRGSEAEINGLNLVAFGMGQEEGNNCAEGCQLSLILGGQASSIEGGAQAVATVGTIMTATVTQVQMANQVQTAP
jgi:hypothetical protein